MLKYKVKRVRCGYVVTELNCSDVKNLTTVFTKEEKQKMINELFAWVVSDLKIYGDEVIIQVGYDQTVFGSEIGKYVNENFRDEDVGIY